MLDIAICGHFVIIFFERRIGVIDSGYFPQLRCDSSSGTVRGAIEVHLRSRSEGPRYSGGLTYGWGSVVRIGEAGTVGTAGPTY